MRGCKCERCKKPKPPNVLHIHHKTYERIFEEREADLEILCPRCHAIEHGKIKIKKVKITKVSASGNTVKYDRKKRRALSGVDRIKKRNKNGKYKDKATYQRALFNAQKRRDKFL